MGQPSQSSQRTSNIFDEAALYVDYDLQRNIHHTGHDEYCVADHGVADLPRPPAGVPPHAGTTSAAHHEEIAANTIAPASSSLLETKTKMKTKRLFRKTAMCKHLLAHGCCPRYDNCHFAHSVDELQERPSLDKTSWCKTFRNFGVCEDPTCRFAHCAEELRSTVNYRHTKPCRFFYASSGKSCITDGLRSMPVLENYCIHGRHCRFSHGG